MQEGATIGERDELCKGIRSLGTAEEGRMSDLGGAGGRVRSGPSGMPKEAEGTWGGNRRCHLVCGHRKELLGGRRLE